MGTKGRNEVTLTFAGDSADLERAFDRVGEASRDMEKKVSASSRGAADSFDRFGEAADNVDTRAMGFRDSLTGLQDSMAATTALAKGDFFDALLLAGFGIGDLASGIYNFAAPALKNLVTKLGAAKLALAGLGVAAAAAAVVGLVVLSRQTKVTGNDISTVREDLERMVRVGQTTVTLKKFFGEGAEAVANFKADLDGASNTFFRITSDIGTLGGALGDRAVDKFNELDTALAQITDSGGDADAVFSALVTTYGLNLDEVERLKSVLPQYAEAQKRANERTTDTEKANTDASTAIKTHIRSVKDLADTLRAQTDPVFAFVRAQRDVVDAQNAVNEAAKEYGRKSPQYQQAVLDLAQAQLGLVDATAKVSGVTNASLIPTLRQLVADGHLSKQAFDAVTQAINSAKSAAEALDGTRIDLTVNVKRTGDKSIDIDGSIPWGSIPAFHSGGVMPGAPGSEGLALLKAGEKILPPGQGNGSQVVVQYSGGSGLGRWFLSELEGLLRANNLTLVRK